MTQKANAPDSVVRPDKFSRNGLLMRRVLHNFSNKDRFGETLLRDDPAQRWIYFCHIRRDEALLLKTHDSKDDGGVVRWTVHAAAKDPLSDAEKPPRESIDIRCICFFAPGDKYSGHDEVKYIRRELGIAICFGSAVA